MFKVLLNIIPNLSKKDLDKMDKQLTRRFTRLAKSFGKGLVNVLKGGGVVGLAIGLIDKLLNPLKEVQDTLDRTLKSSSDLVTNAKQFGTDAGSLARLVAMGEAKGLEAGDIYTLLTKFQTSIAEAEADPAKDTSVRQYVGSKDTAAAFFEFIQSLQKRDRNDQIRVQQEVFGEKAILKTASFLQADFENLSKAFQKYDTKTVTRALEKTDTIADTNDRLTAARNYEDLVGKSRVINESMVQQYDKRMRLEQERENQRLQGYNALGTISEASTKILGLVETGMIKLTELVTKVTNMQTTIDKIPGSKFFKGIFGGGDK